EQRMFIVNYLTALAATLAFKLALFSYAASGAEGITSALAWYPRLVLCLGWDVLSSAIVAGVAYAIAGPLASRRPRAALAWSLGVLVLLSLGAVPGLANGVLAVHTFGLERSPLTMLLGSYLKGPLRVLHAREAAPADPFCLDLTSPVPVEGTDPLIAATAKR